MGESGLDGPVWPSPDARPAGRTSTHDVVTKTTTTQGRTSLAASLRSLQAQGEESKWRDFNFMMVEQQQSIEDGNGPHAKTQHPTVPPPPHRGSVMVWAMALSLLGLTAQWYHFRQEAARVTNRTFISPQKSTAADTSFFGAEEGDGSQDDNRLIVLSLIHI